MEKPVKKKFIFTKLAGVITLVFALALLLSQFSSGINPATFWPAEIMAISYPFWLVINFCLLLYWLILQHRFGFISFIAIAMGYQTLNNSFQFRFKENKLPASAEVKQFSLMSYNVRLFDLYNWTGNLKTRAKIFDLLRTESPDIVCFQEFFTNDNSNFDNTDTLSAILKADNRHVEYAITVRKTQHWGMATYTKFPIVGKGKIVFERYRNNFGLFTDIKIESDTVRIYNIHLQSNHFKKEDYEFINAPDSGSNEQLLRSSKNIISRLKKGAIKRAKQLEELMMHIEKSPYPVIVCGDFNDPPFSYVYRTLSENLFDTFVEKGKGGGITYTGKPALFRIDFILHDDFLNCYDHQVLSPKLSDHYAVKTILTVE